MLFTGCYGYATEESVTPLTHGTFPPTENVTLVYRPPQPDEHCSLIALLEVAGSETAETSTVLKRLVEAARRAGADTVFSISVGWTALASSDIFAPHNREHVYSSHVVTGLAARCTSLLSAGNTRYGWFGYVFGEDPSTVARLCTSEGNQWTEVANGALCSGLPAAFGLKGRLAFGFRGDHLSKIDVVARVNGETGTVWRSTYELFSQSIQQSYGPPSQRQSLVPPACSRDALLTCLGNGMATYSSGWSWSNGASIWVLLTNDAQKPVIRLVFDAGLPATG